MKGWQVALISLLTFVVGGGIGLTVGGVSGGLLGGVAGLIMGSCDTSREAVKQKLFTEEQASQLMTTVADNLAAKGDNKTNSDPQAIEKMKKGLKDCLKSGSVEINW